jgi:mRNA interferase MazF
LNSSLPLPRRGEVWQVNFDPTIGSEIQKKRPAIVISSDAVGKLPIKLIAPITEWKDAFKDNIWHIQIVPDASNGLDKASAVDTLQIRGVDTARFIKKIGRVSSTVIEEIAAAVSIIIEYQ